MEKKKEKLLNILSENAQLSNEQLSVMIDESLDFVKEAKKEFEKEGIIKGYKTLVNWEKFGKATASAIITMKTEPLSSRQNPASSPARSIWKWASIILPRQWRST